MKKELVLRRKALKGKNNGDTITVTTKDELKNALETKPVQIIVTGDLADKLKKAKKISKLSKVSLAVLTAALGAGAAAIPFTGGLSLAAFAVVPAASTGLSVAAIITASALGIALILAVYKGYDEIEYRPEKLTLRRKRE